jgi:hypothetical protein
MKPLILAGIYFTFLIFSVRTQLAAAQQSVWHDPQVRYLLADMTLGGNTELYRQYGQQNDPDSREAMRLWDAGARVANTNDFERKWVPTKYGKDGRAMRIVFRGTQRTIGGEEVLLTSDGQFDSSIVRAVLLDLSLGADPRQYTVRRAQDPEVAEALRCWEAGARVINADLFTRRKGSRSSFCYRATGRPAAITRAILNSDLPFSELNIRYFMADIALGGSLEFYRGAAESAHEMNCLEAVRRTEDGYRITNLDQFERKQVDGKTLITHKGENLRINGMDVKLSSD